MSGLQRPISRLESLDGNIIVVGADDDRPYPAEIIDAFVLGLYAEPGGCCGDWGRPVAEIRSGTDDLVVTRNVVSYAFPGRPFERLGAGTYWLVLVATLQGRSSEFLREPLTVV